MLKKHYKLLKKRSKNAAKGVSSISNLRSIVKLVEWQSALKKSQINNTTILKTSIE